MFSVRLEHIVKVFDEKKVLNDVSLSFMSGYVYGIVGENGAGKSTLMHIVSGLFPANSGDVFINDKKCVFKSSFDAINAGIGMVYQNPPLANSLSIWECCIFAHGVEASFFLSKKKHLVRLHSLCSQWGIQIDVERKVSSLSTDERLYATLLIVLYQSPQLLILDEPTASLTVDQREVFIQFVRQAVSKGMIVLFISHNLEETLNVCDYITVLRTGTVVAQLKVKENTYTTNDLQDLMYGSRIAADTAIRKKKPVSAEVLLTVSNLQVQPYVGSSLNGISFSVNAGEMVLISGKRESGLETLENVLSDMYAEPYSGTITVSAKKKALLPSNRVLRASHPDLYVYEMLMPHALKNMRTGFFIDRKKRTAFAQSLIAQENLPILPSQKVSDLSGGMLQRLILARELEQKPDLLIFIEPTYGLDVQTSERIQKNIQAAAESGSGVLILSADNEIQQTYYDVVYTLVGGVLQKEQFETHE